MARTNNSPSSFLACHDAPKDGASLSGSAGLERAGILERRI
jgi:hypothetical protein